MVTVDRDTTFEKTNLLEASLFSIPNYLRGLVDRSISPTITSSKRIKTGSILRFENFLGKKEENTSLKPVEVDRNHILALLNLISCQEQSSTNYELESIDNLELEQFVLIEFVTIPKVVKIYAEMFRSEFIFTVFTDSESYDDSLMDALLIKELDILERFPDKPITIHYLPQRSNIHPSRFVSEGAKLIFWG